MTSDPNRDHTEPISNPMIPPPMTIIFFGTSVSAMAPVEVMTFFSSIVRPGKGVLSLPVAMKMFFPRTLVSPPSAKFTAIVCSSANVPVPFKYSTLFFLNRNSMPFVRPETEVSLAFIICCRLSLTSPTSMPRFLVSCRIWWYMWELLRRDLEGMQPTFRQVPPRAPRFSTHATWRCLS